MSSAGGSHAQPALRIPWNRLRAWIDEQEAKEKQPHANGGLNETQLKAISLLIPVFEEPHVSEKDYVSKLLSICPPLLSSGRADADDSGRSISAHPGPAPEPASVHRP